VLYSALSVYDWSSLYKKTSPDAAVDTLNIAVTENKKLALPSVYIKKYKNPNRFSGKLKFYVKKNNSFYRLYKKCWTVCFVTNYLFTGNWVK
jgi:hypothetical protein